MGTDEILHQYVQEFECTSILTKAHGGVAGGHYVGRETTQKLLGAGLWWLTVHKDSKAFFKACDSCQRMGKPLCRYQFP